MAKIKLKPVHDELDKLAKNLRKHELRGMLRPTATRTSEMWVGALEIAVSELEDWCQRNTNPPDEPFTIDVPPLS